MAEVVEHFPGLRPGPRKEKGVKTNRVDLKKVGVGVVGAVGAAAAVAYGASEIKEQQQTPELPAEALFLAFHPEQRDQLTSSTLSEEARIQIAGTKKGAEDILKEIDAVAPADEIGRSFGIFTPEEMSGLLGSLPGGAKLESLRILTLTTEDGEKTQFLFAQNGQGNLEAVKYVVSQDSREPGFVGWSKPVTQRDNELWSLVWNIDKGEWTWVFYGGSGDNFGKPGGSEIPAAAPTVPSVPLTETPTKEPTKTETPTQTPTEIPTKTATPKPTETATPKPTETATPVPTPEAPFFKDRTEGRYTGKFYLERTKEWGSIIYPPENDPAYKYSPDGVHEEALALPDNDKVKALDTRVIGIDKANNLIILDIGLGRQIIRQMPVPDRFYLFPNPYPRGLTRPQWYIEGNGKGGNIYDLDEGDLVKILSPLNQSIDLNPQPQKLWGLLTVK